MATQETQREWLGLGQMGWGIYAVIALATLYNELQMPDQGLPIVLIAAIVVVLQIGRASCRERVLRLV